MSIIIEIEKDLKKDRVLPLYIKLSTFEIVKQKKNIKIESKEYQTNSYFILQLYKPINIYETSFKME